MNINDALETVIWRSWPRGQTFEHDGWVVKVERAAAPVEVDAQPWENIPVEKMPISNRAYMGLRNAGILTAGQTAKACPEELLRLPNFGMKSLNDVKTAISVMKCLTAPREND